MRKIFGILFLVGLVAITACGPSKKEQAAEQARQDSIAAVEEQALQDSIAAAEAAAAAANQQEQAAMEEAEVSEPADTKPSRRGDTQDKTEEDKPTRRGEQSEDEDKEESKPARRGS
ncbi:MAG: hypothetical protein ABR597_03130 [Bacteroidales bacterium]